MTSEEMQKTMAFILEQQASSSVKLDELVEAQKRAEERWIRTEDGIRALLSIAEIHEREITAQSQQILSLREQSQATDERLNLLINIVERHISEGRKGKP